MQIKNKIEKSSVNDVFVIHRDIADISIDDLSIVIEASRHSEKKRARLNLHNSLEDLIHEMIIVIQKDSYIRPHKHSMKAETFHLIKGSADVVIFNEDGSIQQVVQLSIEETRKPFIYRLSPNYFHTFLIKSDELIIHEITNGPYNKDETVYANFSPEDINQHGVNNYKKQLCENILKMSSKHDNF